jgi:DTW domain-containing protein YfiP
MNRELYLEKRKILISLEEKFREMCLDCRQPSFNCYCSVVEKIDPKVKFVILTHPIEVRRRIATGRMSHLCLANSELIIGHNFTENKKVNSILEDPKFQSVILYPGRQALNISRLPVDQRKPFTPEGKQLALFVIDGTWNTARKMLHLSENLKTIPQICFTPERLSNFRVRKQPAPECVSTIEAIHQTIELIGPHIGFATETREHDKLLKVFDRLVEQQLVFVQRANSRHVKRIRRSA